MSRPVKGLAAAVLASSLLPPEAAWADAPLGYLRGSGARAYPVTALTWGMLIISVAVIVIIAVLGAAALARRRPPATAESGRLPVGPDAGGTSWIYLGTGISTAVLIAVAVWTFTTLAAVGDVPANPVVTIEVTGHQWWWEVRYLSDDPARIFTTANEIHIPTGAPVRIRLIGADVIHSFWVPALSGKTDAIPGQTNLTWLEADRPGVYYGQCTEYCGQQHAHMALAVIASKPDQFRAWWTHQLKPALPPAAPDIAEGEAAFLQHCGACHAVRGSGARGIFGPDLSHLMTRGTLAAGTIPNTPGYLSAWIADPQHLKPGSQMPILDLTGPQLADIRSFLQTLR